MTLLIVPLSLPIFLASSKDYALCRQCNDIYKRYVQEQYELDNEYIEFYYYSSLFVSKVLADRHNGSIVEYEDVVNALTSIQFNTDTLEFCRKRILACLNNEEFDTRELTIGMKEIITHVCYLARFTYMNEYFLCWLIYSLLILVWYKVIMQRNKNDSSYLTEDITLEE